MNMNTVAKFWGYGAFSAFIAVILMEATIQRGSLLTDIDWLAAYWGASAAWLIPFMTWTVFIKGFRHYGWAIRAALWMGFVTIGGIMLGLSPIPLPDPDTSDLLHYTSLFLSFNTMFSGILATVGATWYVIETIQKTDKQKKLPTDSSYEMLEWRLADDRPVKFQHENRDHRLVTEDKTE